MTADPDLDFTWRHVAADARDEQTRWRDAGGLVLDLRRRGIEHGALVVGDRPPTPTAEPTTAWRATEPVFWPDALTDHVAEHAAAITESLQMFGRLRRGTRFLDEIEQRLWDDETFRYASSTIDASDQREIEKVYVEAPSGPASYHARELSAKLSWIADDRRDRSLRIRFSFGHEATRDWLEPDARAVWSDRFAEHVFPECAIVVEHRPLRERLESLLAKPYRLSERIVYNNVPGGGAMFHHDADPGQRGVVFAQFAGATVWLALSRERLAARVADCGLTMPEPTAEPDRELWTLLNATPSFTVGLIEAGHAFALGPGDVLMLPSHDVEHCVWHSVFGVGDAPSLAHSYAVFDAVGG